MATPINGINVALDSFMIDSQATASLLATSPQGKVEQPKSKETPKILTHEHAPVLVQSNENGVFEWKEVKCDHAPLPDLPKPFLHADIIYDSETVCLEELAFTPNYDNPCHFCQNHITYPVMTLNGRFVCHIDMYCANCILEARYLGTYKDNVLRMDRMVFNSNLLFHIRRALFFQMLPDLPFMNTLPPEIVHKIADMTFTPQMFKKLGNLAPTQLYSDVTTGISRSVNSTINDVVNKVKVEVKKSTDEMNERIGRMETKVSTAADAFIELQKVVTDTLTSMFDGDTSTMIVKYVENVISLMSMIYLMTRMVNNFDRTMLLTQFVTAHHIPTQVYNYVSKLLFVREGAEAASELANAAVQKMKQNAEAAKKRAFDMGFTAGTYIDYASFQMLELFTNILDSMTELRKKMPKVDANVVQDYKGRLKSWVEAAKDRLKPSVIKQAENTFAHVMDADDFMRERELWTMFMNRVQDAVPPSPQSEVLNTQSGESSGKENVFMGLYNLLKALLFPVDQKEMKLNIERGRLFTTSWHAIKDLGELMATFRHALELLRSKLGLNFKELEYEELQKDVNKYIVDASCDVMAITTSNDTKDNLARAKNRLVTGQHLKVRMVSLPDLDYKTVNALERYISAFDSYVRDFKNQENIRMKEYMSVEYGKAVRNLVDRINVAKAKEVDKQVLINVEARDAVITMYNEVLSVNSKLIGVRLDPSLLQSLSRCQEWLTTTVAFINSAKRFTKTRPLPVAVFLHGKPGVGKSNATEILSQIIYKAIHGVDADIESIVYHKQFQDQYWSGYRNQYVTICDEAFKVDQRDEKSREAAEYIGMINDINYPLNMAGLEEKGSLFFTSRLLWITSNVEVNNFTDVGLSDITAFTRRIHYNVRVKREGEFMNRALADDELLKGLTFEVIDVNFEGKISIKKEYTPIEFATVIVKRLLEHEHRGSMWDRAKSITSEPAESIRKTLKLRTQSGKEGPKAVTSRQNVFEDEEPERPPPKKKEITKQTRCTSVLTPCAHCPSNPQILYGKFFITVEDYPICERCIADQHFAENDLRALYFDPSYESIHALAADAVVYLMVDENHKMAVTVQDVTYGDNGIDVWATGNLYRARRASERAKRNITQISAQTKSLIDMVELEKERFSLAATSELADTNLEIAQTIGSLPNPKTKAKSMAELVKNHWKWLLLGVGALSGIIAAAVATIKIYKHSKYNTESGHYDHDKRKVEYKTVKVNEIKVGEPIHMQMGEEFVTQATDNAATDIITHLLSKNMVKLKWARNDEAYDSYVQALFVKGNVMLSVLHFFAIRPTDVTHLLVSTTTEVHAIPLEAIEVKKFGPDMSYITVKAPGFPFFKDITKHFVKEQDLINDVTTLALVKTTPDCMMINFGQGQLRKVPLNYSDPDGTTYSLDRYIEFRAPTEDGDCGCPYVIYNTKITRKIVALHTAGNSNSYMAIGHLVTQEDLARMGIRTQMGMEINFPPTCEVLGEVPPNEAPRLPEKSQITESLICGLVAPTTMKQAHLKPFKNAQGEKISPAQVGISKFDRPPVEHTPEDFDDMFKIAEYIEDQLDYPVVPREFTKMQAINGEHTMKHSKKLHFDTSCGYPWDLERAGKGKWPYMQCTQCNIVGEKCKCEAPHMPTPVMDKAIDDLYNQISNHPVVSRYKETDSTIDIIKDLWDNDDLLDDIVVVWKDCLKDEKRPIEKVEKGKTRLFSAAPMHFTIVKRMLNQAFNEMFSQDPVNGLSAMGINPHSPDWGNLLKRLEKFGIELRLLPGDFSNFDAWIRKILSICAIWIMVTWYERYYKFNNIPNWHELRMKQIILHIKTYKPVHIIFNKLYKLDGGQNPSGDIETTTYNVLCNALAHCFSAIKQSREEEDVTELTPAAYFRLFGFTAFGDDHIEATAQKWYTMQKKARWMRYLGMEYTDVFKRPLEDVEYYTVDQLSYLKRTFRIEGGLTFAPLDKQVIYEMTNWIKINHLSPLANTLQNCESSCREMFHYGRQDFDEYVKKLKDIVKFKLHTTLNVKSYDDYMKDYLKLRLFPQMKRSKGMIPVRRVKKLNVDIIKVIVNEPPTSPDTAVKQHTVILKPQSGKEANALSTEKDALTIFEDDAEPDTTIDNPGLKSKIYRPDPYPDQGLTKYLTRVYELDQFQWSGASTAGMLIGAYVFPKDLLVVPLLASVLERFLYFRAAVKVSFRVNSTQFHYGQLLFSYQPYYDALAPYTYERAGNIYQASCNECTIVSASYRQPIEIIIPYVAPQSYYAMTDTTTRDGFFGSVSIYVLAPLKQSNISGTPAVDISVFVELVEPEVAGFKTQSGKDELVAEDVKATKKRMISDYTEMMSAVTAPMTVLPYVGGIAGASSVILKAATMMFRFFGYSKPRNLELPRRVQLTPMDNMAHGMGVSTDTKLSLDPEAHVANDWRYYNTKVDYDLMINYIRLPSLFKIGYFDTTSVPGDNLFYIPVHPTLCYTNGVITYPTHLANASQVATLWSGSIKYTIQFVGSPFATCRLRIVWSLVKYTSLTDLEEGNVISKIIDVTGDTITEFAIPFAVRSPWIAINTSNAQETGNGFISVFVVNRVVTADTVTSSTIYYNCWIAGGEDFILSRPRPSYRVVTPQSGTDNPRVNFERPFEPLFPASTCLTKNLTSSDCIRRWTDIGRRMIYWENATIVRTGNIAEYEFSSLDLYDMTSRDRFWQILFTTFKFWRGGLRLTYVPLNGDEEEVYFTSNEHGSVSYTGENYITNSSGGLAMTDSSRRVIDVELPQYQASYFYGPDQFCGCNSNKIKITSYARTSAMPAASVDFISYLSLANDFSVGYPACPAPWTDPVLKEKTITEDDFEAISKNDNRSKFEKRKVVVTPQMKKSTMTTPIKEVDKNRTHMVIHYTFKGNTLKSRARVNHIIAETQKLIAEISREPDVEDVIASVNHMYAAEEWTILCEILHDAKAKFRSVTCYHFEQGTGKYFIHSFMPQLQYENSCSFSVVHVMYSRREALDFGAIADYLWKLYQGSTKVSEIMAWFSEGVDEERNLTNTPEIGTALKDELSRRGMVFKNIPPIVLPQ